MVKLKSIYTDFDRLPLMLNAGDVAAIMRISRAGAYNLINTKTFPAVKFGKRIVVDKNDLVLWLQQNKRQYIQQH